MKYDDLIKENKIKQEKVHPGEIEDLFSLAERDLKTAEFIVVKLKELCL